MIVPTIKPVILMCLGVFISRLLNQISQSPLTAERSLRKGDDDDDGDGGRDDGVARRPKLGDGCRHVFLDVGSNIGVHARILFEPGLYPPPSSEPRRAGKAGKRRGRRRRTREEKFSARAFFASQFGDERTRDNAQFCVFAFEPNPAHASRHREMERAYGAMGWRYRFLPAGAGDEDGTLTFYHIGKGNKELERGFTTARSRCRKDCRPEEVAVVRLSDWIEREIRGRTIPPLTPSESGDAADALPPRVVMKMDIEMGEWLVLPDLLASGALCRDVDALLGEFHLEGFANDYPVTFPGRGAGKGGNWTLESHEDARRLKDELFGMVERNPNCGTRIVEGDDESHATDGMPWPVPGDGASVDA